jgi:hypothetical protein
MTNSNQRDNPRTDPHVLVTGLVLVLSLFTCRSLEAGVIVASSLSLTQLQIIPPGATPGSYDFADFSGSFPATLVTISVTGTSTGQMQLNTNGTPDYTGGDRILLSVTNSTGVSWSGITFGITGTTFLGDPIDPSRGTFVSNTYTSDLNQRVNSPDGDVSATSTSASFTFDSILGSGSTTYFYLQAADNGSLPNGNFDLSETPTVAGAVPEPTMIVPLGLALLALAGLRRRFRS